MKMLPLSGTVTLSAGFCSNFCCKGGFLKQLYLDKNDFLRHNTPQKEVSTHASSNDESVEHLPSFSFSMSN